MAFSSSRRHGGRCKVPWRAAAHEILDHLSGALPAGGPGLRQALHAIDQPLLLRGGWLGGHREFLAALYGASIPRRLRGRRPAAE
jgi:hypothetical protein